ncbi:hypothetical protein SDC9_179461 [bioreactor metagenome]|uniref:Uncharacterized protein n=1 Tax=bioreactor metagenome TaxID=1076179 RepID=A0A645H0I9_9ZZZZ
MTAHSRTGCRAVTGQHGDSFNSRLAQLPDNSRHPFPDGIKDAHDGYQLLMMSQEHGSRTLVLLLLHIIGLLRGNCNAIGLQ